MRSGVFFGAFGSEVHSTAFAFAAALELCHGLARRLEVFRTGKLSKGANSNCR